MSKKDLNVDEDVVWVASGLRKRNVYHTDPDCSRLQRIGSLRELSPNQLNARWRECKYCAHNQEYIQGEREEKTCDKCGNTYKNLADHLFNCKEWE